MSLTPKDSVVSVRNKQIIFYPKYYGEWTRSNNTENLLQNKTSVSGKKQGDYNGYMSPNTKRAVSKYLETWVESIKAMRTRFDYKEIKKQLPYFTFVTLTLASDQKHDDKFIKRNLLMRFIEEQQKKGTFKYYFWRAEPQTNGRIHFHLVVDKYIDYKYLRDEWNKKQDLHGYLDDYRDRMTEKYREGFFVDKSLTYYDKKTKTSSPISAEQQLKNYQLGKSSNWSNPNSTDIKAVKNIKDLTAYLIKYLCKTDNNEKVQRKIEGRIYGKSKELISLAPYTCSEFDVLFNSFIGYAYNRGLVHKELDIVGNGSVVVLLGNFRLALQKSKFYSKLRRYYEEVVRKLYMPDLTCSIN